jgi:phosphoribosylglycinamide formyltransferase-1
MLTLVKSCPSCNFLSVISNNPSAAGISLLQELGIDTLSFARANFTDVKSFKAAIRNATARLQPDLVVLAGYMQILEPEFIAAFPRRILNIHPSLLPSFPGLDTHARALAAGQTKHGCTVHLVDAGVDTGPIVAQASVAISPGETPESLAAKVLEREHVLYPWVLNQLVAGEIEIGPDSIIASPEALASATEMNFTIGGQSG